ncbi:hypothetical protein FF011L_38860 [Roseimaritima multifibrata]|uniref:Plasmid stabilization system protein n=1 Tax=Roseimaritima multifibrata TaxID=1930274 RepID=A0A517MJN2_9BACT|nr:hypothetical protein FF011L_38860 [Roseimaritima multifibrata]
MDIRWTEKASSDALGIFDYVAAQSLAYAESVYERILERPGQLTVHPNSGSVVPEFGRDDIHECFCLFVSTNLSNRERRNPRIDCHPRQPNTGS